MSTDNGLTVILIALVLGALIGGIMADTLGRRPIMFIAMGLALSFQITMVTVETCLVYATLRALCGIFSGKICFMIFSFEEDVYLHETILAQGHETRAPREG